MYLLRSLAYATAISVLVVPVDGRIDMPKNWAFASFALVLYDQFTLTVDTSTVLTVTDDAPTAGAPAWAKLNLAYGLVPLELDAAIWKT